VRVMVARGHLIVAAVGNDGPSAEPLYPAAYDGVIAVTGVDARNRVLLEACRGKHVDFAAPGADLSAASSGEIYALVRGTSFAAPIVSGLLAGHLAQPDRAAADAAIAKLIAQATDLGARGPDKVYGYGLVGAPLRNARSAAGK
jgi:subtilisin family serine protease